MAAIKLLDFLRSATQADLAEVEKPLNEINEERDALIDVKKILAKKLGVMAESKADGGTGTRSSHGEKMRRTKQARADLAAYLLHAGPTKKSAIVLQFNYKDGEFEKYIDSPWFKETMGAYALTEQGKEAAEDAE